MEFWAFLLLGLGLVIVMLEVFIPSAGLLGIIAAAAILSGGVLAWRADSGVFSIYLGLAFVLVPVVVALGLKLFPKTPFGRRMTLGGSTFDPAEAAAGGDQYAGLADQRGVAHTTLRPAGKARIAGRLVDVVTRGELIDRGQPVRVLRVEGNRVFVGAAEPDTDDTSNPSLDGGPPQSGRREEPQT